MERMDWWAAYLRGQADALGLPVIHTTDAGIGAVADLLEVVVRRFPETDAPAT
jgi:hypothetical protein